eukprot:m.27831 g.27831  ORF g.27831 m.27831 type:complete len:177 (-) comp15818_c0_seq1:183-713(-)
MPAQVRLSNVAIAVFLCSASVLSIVSLASPEWIVQDLHGRVTYGLTVTCSKPLFDDSTSELDCGPNKNTPGAWIAALFFISVGCISLILSSVAGVAAFLKPKELKKSKWFGLTSAVCYCIATLIFPAGFNHDDIGGSVYKLPENSSIGFSYIVFIIALLFIFFAEMLTVKLTFEDN